MKINGMDGMTAMELNSELAKGGKFVVFQYCISILVMTFRRGSAIYFIRADEGTFGASLKYTLISLFFGWWGIPWGPIYTIGAFITNFKGGKDVTAAVLAAMKS